MASTFTLKAEGASLKEYARPNAIRGLSIRLRRAVAALKAEANDEHTPDDLRAPLHEAAVLLERIRAEAARQPYRS